MAPDDTPASTTSGARAEGSPVGGGPPGSSPPRGASQQGGSGGAEEVPRREHVVLDDVGIRRALMRIAHEIVERNDELASLYLVGIPNGGVPLARQLAANLRQIADLDAVVGILDTTLYRDDLVSAGARPRLRRTEMPSAVDDRVVVLVDDVASTGRTIRAAMDALMDFGRPRAVQVVALIDRGHRELPIRIDYVGKNIPTRRSDRVNLRTREGGPEGAMEVVVVADEGGSPR